ncbi:hypothetical protein CKO51_29630 [Rhodopirellula sp. SM50]|nr:hypothetical protein [Rhodopirellula sp. SM50]PAY15875.1 hypothetical protein CKO51_29630 [Rhodopirellula sp. SM50]
MDILGHVLTRTSQWIEHWYVAFTTFDCDLLDRDEWVEFVGGPLDGYRQLVDPAKIYHLPPSLVLPISASRIARFFDMDESESVQPTDLPSSYALYDLVACGDRWCYRFSQDEAGA